MTEQFHLTPLTDTVVEIVNGIDDEQLDDPTPCAGISVAQLVEHLLMLSGEFARAARKQNDPGAGPTGGGIRPEDPHVVLDRLPVSWREAVRGALGDLAVAWRDQAAWEGETAAGGLTMPAQVTAMVATNEVLLHGWDLARATGQPFDPDPAAVEFAHGFVSSFDGNAPTDLFGPPVPVGNDASAMDRTVALSGRDPRWRPPTPE